MSTDRRHIPTRFEIDQGAQFCLTERPRHEAWTQAEVDEEIKFAFCVGANWVLRRQLGTQGRRLTKKAEQE
jgi:hypothetical protein